MEYKIYKLYNSCFRKGEKPLFTDKKVKVYYDPELNFYREYAATFFTEGNNYRLEGPDEEIKRKIIDNIGDRNFLMRDEGETVNGICWDYMVPTPFDHPEFEKALNDTVSPYGYCTVSPELLDMVKVTSQEEADRLREEYLKTKEKDV